MKHKKEIDYNYNLYRKIKTKAEYFNTWDAENVCTINNDLAEVIYQKYIVKCKVFQRDKFLCQNSECKCPKSPLTYHHIKWKKNGGEDKIKNGVTLCRSCHMGYHKAKKTIVFFNTMTLPSHIRGHTFKLEKPEVLDWKKIKYEMRQFRKTLKHEQGIALTPLQWEILMKFISRPYYEWDD